MIGRVAERRGNLIILEFAPPPGHRRGRSGVGQETGRAGL